MRVSDRKITEGGFENFRRNSIKSSKRGDVEMDEKIRGIIAKNKCF